MPKTRLVIMIFMALLTLAHPAAARDDKMMFPVADVLNREDAKSRLEGVRFYFGEQKHPKIEKEFGEARTNKKTNAFNKTDKEACEWAMLSALLVLHKRALQLGGNAVINIKSNYRDIETVSNTEYQCGAGKAIAGVALKGKVVKLK
jgi:uncharacterized protein YbjQ (UPF0145 family)